MTPNSSPESEPMQLLPPDGVYVSHATFAEAIQSATHLNKIAEFQIRDDELLVLEGNIGRDFVGCC